MSNPNIRRFKTDRNTTNPIINIYDPVANSYEKENEEKISKLESIKGDLTKWASFFRDYPDIFIDMITPKDSGFKLFFYQRLFLRITMRYKYVFSTFPRAFSKSFLSIFSLYLQCIFYGGLKVFICSGQKQQASSIAKEKIEEIWELFPILKNEVKHYQFQKDYVRIVFHNGSKLDIVAVAESTRGGRRHRGLIEEAILVDGEKLNSVVLPLMNVNRVASCGQVDESENHKANCWVTTAGFKNTFSYMKMIQFLVWMVLKGNAFVFGGDYRIPVMHKLLDPNFVEELKEDGTYSETTFLREYCSVWSGSLDDAFFNGDLIDKHRTLENPEFTPDEKIKGKAFYIVSADVARVEGSQNADTAVTIIKAIPRENGTFTKHIVNVSSFNGEHFQEQAIKLKKLVFRFNARQLIVDAQGLGVGLVDFLVKQNIDEHTGEIFPPFAVTNDEDYSKYKTADALPLLYNVKATHVNASSIHVNCLSQISSGKVKFLTDEMTAKAKLLNSKAGQKMTDDERSKHLTPFITTSIMKDEMMNLRAKQEGKNIILERVNRRIQKDKFSSLEYGLWWLKLQEDKNINKIKDINPNRMFLARKPKF